MTNRVNLTTYIIILKDSAVDASALSVDADATTLSGAGAVSAADELLASLSSAGSVYELLSTTVPSPHLSGRRMSMTLPSPILGLPMLILRLDDEAAELCRLNANVFTMEADALIRVSPIADLGPYNTTVFFPSGAASSASLDRIDQRTLPLDGQFRNAADGAGIDAYILDSGIFAGHTEFRGRVAKGANFAEDRATGDNTDFTDCSGHGTHVSSLLGGTKYGAAKLVRIHAVRVMKCDNEGTLVAALFGIDFVLRTVKETPSRHFVVNLSWGGSNSPVLAAGVARLVAAGGLVTAAAGNEDKDACTVSPANSPGILAVASSSISDKYSSFSNFGPCVAIIAPAEFVIGAGIASPIDTQILSGTSMASPLVAGVAADYWQLHPQQTAREVREALLCSSSFGAIRGLPNPQTTSRLLYSDPSGWMDLQEDCRALSAASARSLPATSAIFCTVIALAWHIRGR